MAVAHHLLSSSKTIIIIPSLTNVNNISALSLLVLLLLWYCYRSITAAARQRRAKQSSGCEEPARYPHRSFFGVDLIRLRTEEAQRHEFLQREQERIERFGRFGTYAIVQGFEWSMCLSLSFLVWYQLDINIRSMLES